MVIKTTSKGKSYLKSGAAPLFRSLVTSLVSVKPSVISLYLVCLQMVASGDDIEAVCLILTGNMKEGDTVVTTGESTPLEKQPGEIYL